MKKLIYMLFVLVFILSLVGCSNGSIKGIDKATEIEVIQYDKLSGAEIGTVVLTEEDAIKYIVDNINSLKFKKMSYNEPTVLEYKLVFCNSNNKVIKTISVPVNDWLGFDGFFHSITRGEFDRVYIAGLFE